MAVKMGITKKVVLVDVDIYLLTINLVNGVAFNHEPFFVQ